MQGGNPGLASAIGNLGNAYRSYIATFSAGFTLPDQRGSQTAVPVSYMRVSTAREPPQKPDISKPYPNQPVYTDAKNIHYYQAKNNGFSPPTQLNGSSGGDQTNDVRYQSQTSSSDYQSKSKAFSTQAAVNDSQIAQTNSSSDRQPEFNASNTQAIVNDGQVGQPTSDTDYPPNSNAFSTQAVISDGQVAQTTSSTDMQPKSNTSNTQAQINGGQVAQTTSSTYYQPKNNVSNAQAAINDSQIAQPTSPSDSEFFEILKLGIKLSDPVLSDILHVYSPIVLGPVGSPLGALAGAILASAGKFAATHSAPIHDFRQGLPYDGVLERSILGEAAFIVVMSMKRRKLEELGIFADMAEIVNKMSPVTKELAPFIMHILTAPALRVALHALNVDPGRSRSRPEVTVSEHENPFAQPYSPSTGNLELEVDIFLQRLLAHCLDDDESKESFGNINRIIQIGFREAGPVLTTTAHEGLEYLTSTLPDSGVQGPGIPSRKPYIVGLPERAMLGEAALQALINVPQHQLPERVFDIMAQTIDSIGGIVLQLAPGLIEDVGFLIKAMVVVPSISADGIVDDRTGNDDIVDDRTGNNDIVDDYIADDVVDDGISAETLAGEASHSAANRHAKGFSFVNLEQEFLNYYRDNNLKPMAPIVEG